VCISGGRRVKQNIKADATSHHAWALIVYCVMVGWWGLWCGVWGKGGWGRGGWWGFSQTSVKLSSEEQGILPGGGCLLGCVRQQLPVEADVGLRGTRASEAAVRLPPRAEASNPSRHIPFSQQQVLHHHHHHHHHPSPAALSLLCPPPLQDFVTVLEQCGAGSVSFNSITGPNITKALTAIAEAEGYSLEQHPAAGLVEGAAGDLRNAIQNLQLLLQGPGAAKINKAKAKGKVSGGCGAVGLYASEGGQLWGLLGQRLADLRGWSQLPKWR